QGKGDAREAIRRQRSALEALVRAARGELGGKASEAVTAKIRQTLEAAAVDDDSAAEGRAGRLAKELEPSGFGSLLAHAPASPPAQRRKREDPAASRKALADARARLREAEDEHRAAVAEERQAHKRWQQAVEESERAAERVDELREQLEALRGR